MLFASYSNHATKTSFGKINYIKVHRILKAVHKTLMVERTAYLYLK